MTDYETNYVQSPFRYFEQYSLEGAWFYLVLGNGPLGKLWIFLLRWFLCFLLKGVNAFCSVHHLFIPPHCDRL